MFFTTRIIAQYCTGHPPATNPAFAILSSSMNQQVCVDLMLWSSSRVREFYDAGTLGAVSRVTGGRVTYLRGGDPGGRDTESHLREQLMGALRDHAGSASEAILKVRFGSWRLGSSFIGRVQVIQPCQRHEAAFLSAAER